MAGEIVAMTAPYREGELLHAIDENVKLKREIDKLKEQLVAAAPDSRDVVVAQLMLHTSSSAVLYSIIAACAGGPFFNHPTALGILGALNFFTYALTWTVRKFNL